MARVILQSKTTGGQSETASVAYLPPPVLLASSTR